MSGLQQVITFRLGPELFAAPLSAVERVLRYMAPVRSPDVPAWVSGTIPYQQRSIPVVDLRTRFSIVAPPLAGEGRLLVFRVAGEPVAGIVDGVLDVSSVDPSAVVPAPVLRGLPSDHIVGITRRAGALVAVLDMERVFSAAERAALSVPVVAHA